MVDWITPLKVELEVAKIISQQEINGVAFDLHKANNYVKELELKRQNLYNDIRPYLDNEVEQVGVSIEKPFKLNGDYRKSVHDWYGEDADLVSGPFSRIEISDPDIGSRQKLIKQLLKHGWKPTEFTPTGQPKLTNQGKPVDSISEIDAPIGKQIAEWYILQHRQSQIEGWISSIRPDNRLTAGANSCGTNTCRMRHHTVVNVPKADPKVLFGKQMRSLFIPEPGLSLLGYDASGLEARCMAHYTYKFDGGEFADIILNGDIHANNARIFFQKETEGLESDDPLFISYRSRGKNGTYCLMYGGQPRKLSSTLGVPLKLGKELFNRFWKENQALGELRDLVIRMHEQRGWVPGVDGRKVYTRSPHSALNTLFQSCGAIIMKVAMILLRDKANEEGVWHRKVLDFHDEGQHEIDPKDIEVINGIERHRLGELAIESIIEAGEILELRCKLDGDYKIGTSWAETH